MAQVPNPAEPGGGPSRGVQNQAYAKKWIDTEPEWRGRLGNGWVGKRQLGQGGQGTVGHWSYEGPDRDQKSVKDVAVKQAIAIRPSRDGSVHGIEKEARFLSMFKGLGTPHIIKMYCHLWEDTGRTNEPFDLLGSNVHRIFLEFCPGGDLWSLYDWYASMGSRHDESDLWALFHCLARALLVIDQGSEDPQNPYWEDDGSKIVHFDIKIENILASNMTIDSEHNDRPIYKIADFGCAEKMDLLQDDKDWERHRYAGTNTWLLPEQIQGDHLLTTKRPWNYPTGDINPNTGKEIYDTFAHGKHYGTPGNVWQVGLIMYIFMIQPNWPPPPMSFWSGYPPQVEAYQSNLSPVLSSGFTLGSDAQIECENTGKHISTVYGYSKFLHQLVAECLMFNQKLRPTPAQLVRATRIALASTNLAQVNTPDRAARMTPYAEPQLSPQWYEGYKLEATRQPSRPVQQQPQETNVAQPAGGQAGVAQVHGTAAQSPNAPAQSQGEAGTIQRPRNLAQSAPLFRPPSMSAQDIQQPNANSPVQPDIGNQGNSQQQPNPSLQTPPSNLASNQGVRNQATTQQQRNASLQPPGSQNVVHPQPSSRLGLSALALTPTTPETQPSPPTGPLQPTPTIAHPPPSPTPQTSSTPQPTAS